MQTDLATNTSSKMVRVNSHPYKIEVVAEGLRLRAHYTWTVAEVGPPLRVICIGTARSLYTAYSQAWREIGERELILGE